MHFGFENVLFEIKALSPINSLKDGSPDSIIKLESKGLSTNKQSFQPAWYQCFISDFVRFCSFLFYLQPY